MTQPVATARLSGIPRTGTLVLPAPRPRYDIMVMRAPEGTDPKKCGAILSVSDAHHNTWQTPLILIPPRYEWEGEGSSRPTYWHGELVLDGYQWRIEAEAEMLWMFVYDDLIQRVAYGRDIQEGGVK